MTVLTNLFTNPSFEATSGTVEVRRNLALNPGIESSAYTRNLGPSGATIEFIPAAAHSGAQGTRATGNETTLNVGRGTSLDGTFPVGRYTGSVLVRPSVDMSISEYWQGTNDHTTVDSQWTHTIVAGVWERLYSTIDVTLAGTLVFGGVGSVPAVGDYLDYDEFLVEKSPTLGDYFDGSISPDTDLTAAWVGTPNASESTLSGAKVAAVTSTTAYQSAKWAVLGTKSLYVPTGGTATVTLATPSTAVVVARNPGQALTVGAASETSVVADQTMKATGVTTVTLGPGYWDTLLIIEGTYTGDYFDGNTLEVPRFAHGFWTGTPNASTSKQWGAP